MDGYQEEAAPKGGWIFLRAIRVALGRVSLWAWTAALLGLAGLALAMPTYQWMGRTVGSRYAPGEVSVGMDTIFRTDHGAAWRSLGASSAATAAVLQFLSVLLGIFVAGGWLQVTLERTSGQAMRRFLYGGARYFMRFTRVALLALLVIALLRWTLYGLPWNKLVLEGWLEVPKHDWRSLEGLSSELQVRRLGWAQDGLMAFLFALTLCWAVYTRTRLALHDSRSVLWAGWCSAMTILRHPIATLRPLLLIALAEVLVVFVLCGALTDFFESRLEAAPRDLWVMALGATGLLALIWREILRGARYHVAVRVSRKVVKPSLRPDPWNVIGGPGGPQYPVDDELDERYGVAL